MDATENDHLIRIMLSQNKDSVIKCADADYKAHKYYYYWSTEQESAFTQFYHTYAKEKYQLILISYGDVSFEGIDYYNNEMGKFLERDKFKTPYKIMEEAKIEYRKTLPGGE